jgi:hypothetical protein
MAAKKFNTSVIPVNELRFAIKVKSSNYFANVDTMIIVDKKTMEVCEDFDCNRMIDAVKFLKDVVKEIGLKVKFNHINRFGMCDLCY